ncbi:DNA repair protein RecN [Aquimonas sp.]|jgi:DNA repair protein RecN (Recombination protein N)|uniref:DNA repair protein RecN n=1 Tax=Aquimonas sp. TaxID=1872588 RepID=UPI0037C0DAC5
MLSSLFVKDFAIVSEVELQLDRGLTVISGETGAGKSLLVDALLLLTGARADASAVRHGAERAELSATFRLPDDSPALAWLREQELDEDGECALRRIVRADGGSKTWINGRPATVSQLGELAGFLVEIHGQHEHQALLDRTQQLGLLDGFARNAEALQPVRAAAVEWQQLKRRREQLAGAATDPGPRLELLRHQLGELSAEALSAEAYAELIQTHRRLANASSLIEACARAVARIEGEDGFDLIRSLRQTATDLARFSEHEPRLREASELLDSASLQATEAGALINQVQDNLDLDPGRLHEIETRLGRLHDLGRRHRVDPSALKDCADALSAEIEELEEAGSAIAKIDTRMQAIASDWAKTAAKLSKRRREFAQTLSREVSLLMAELGMAGGQLQIQLDALPDPEPSPLGAERVEFLVAANAGQPPKPLRRTASGGELSRISLAIEVATLGIDPTPTMVFDEVDTGIGGAVAEIVGQKLRALGRERQVMCVTHLPQVAAQGHHHYSVRKGERDGVTVSAPKRLSPEDRVEEIARMLGGVEITETTRAHATQMLACAARAGLGSGD